MAEYYPLLERAVSGLGVSTPEARQAIYARARSALVAQLGSMDPPVPEEDITRESAALDEAVARLEADLKNKAAAPPADADAGARPPSEPARASRADAEPAADTGGASPGSPAPRPVVRERPVFTPRNRTAPDAASAADRPAPAGVRPRVAVDPAQNRPASPRPTLSARPLAPLARSTGAAPQIGPVQPAPPRPTGPGASGPGPAGAEPAEAPGPTGAPPLLPAARDAAPAPPGAEAPSALPVAPTLDVPGRWSSETDQAADEVADAADTESEPVARRRGRGTRPAMPTIAGTPVRRNYGTYAVVVAIVLIAAAVAVAAYRLRDRPEQVTAANSTAIPTAAAPQNLDPAKISGRAEGGGAAGQATPGATPATEAAPAEGDAGSAPNAPDSGSQAPAQDAAPAEAPAIGVAQRAALLVDAPQDPQRVKTMIGTVVWKSEADSPGQSQTLANAVRADVDVPEAKLTMSMVLKKNSEPQFPASHTLEFHFVAQPGNSLGPVKQINVPEMRRDDNAQTGDPLVGVPVAITENYFLVGLSRGSSETSNMLLIEQRNWFDVSLLFASGRVAKITFEKGVSGQRILDDAVKSWQ